MFRSLCNSMRIHFAFYYLIYSLFQFNCVHMTGGLTLRLNGRFSCNSDVLCSNIKGHEIENFRWMNDE